MFNFKALFIATLLAATATTTWGKAQVILYGSSDCTGSVNSGTIGLHTGVCHSTYVTAEGEAGYANSAHFYTDGVEESYAFYPEDNCGGGGAGREIASGCITGIGDYTSFMKTA